jgi:hypothetical protein
VSSLPAALPLPSPSYSGTAAPTLWRTLSRHVSCCCAPRLASGPPAGRPGRAVSTRRAPRLACRPLLPLACRPPLRPYCTPPLTTVTPPSHEQPVWRRQPALHRRPDAAAVLRRRRPVHMVRRPGRRCRLTHAQRAADSGWRSSSELHAQGWLHTHALTPPALTPRPPKVQHRHRVVVLRRPRAVLLAGAHLPTLRAPLTRHRGRRPSRCYERR